MSLPDLSLVSIYLLSHTFHLSIYCTIRGLKKPIECNVKRVRWKGILPDKVMLNATVDLAKDVKDGYAQVSLYTPLDQGGDDTGSSLKLQFYETKFINGTLGGRSGRISSDFFFRFFVISFKQIYKDLRKGIENLSKPTTKADPDLKLSDPILNNIKYPRDDEQDPFSTLERLLLWFSTVLPYTGRNNPVDDRAKLRNRVRTEKLLSNVIAPHEGKWKAPLSDAVSKFNLDPSH